MNFQLIFLCLSVSFYELTKVFGFSIWLPSHSSIWFLITSLLLSLILKMSAPPPYTSSPHQHVVITQQPGLKKRSHVLFQIIFFNRCWSTVQTVVLQTVQVGPGPSLMTCPNCLATVTTIVDYEISGRTHLCALGLCLIG